MCSNEFSTAPSSALFSGLVETITVHAKCNANNVNVNKCCCFLLETFKKMIPVFKELLDILGINLSCFLASN